MELIVLSLMVGAFFVLFFYISRIFQQPSADQKTDTSGNKIPGIR